MLGGHALGNVLQLAHGNGVGRKLLRVGIDRDDVAQVTPRGELARGAVSGEEDEQAIVLLHAAMGQLVVEGGQDVGARSFLVLQCDDALGRKAELLDQRLAHRARIAHGVLQARPAGVFVNAHHNRPRLAVATRRSSGARSRSSSGLRALGHRKGFAIPGGELVAIGHQLGEDAGQRLHGALVDVVEQDDAPALLLQRRQHALRNRCRHRVGPVQRVHIPHD